MDLRNENAVVAVSGGQDSVTSLYWALRTFKSASAISFYYQQKHSVELDIAKEICAVNKVPHKLVDISFLKDLVVSNLFQEAGDVREASAVDPKLPASFVPYRNVIFLTLASAYASSIGARSVVTGVCQTDYSGYPDCRDIFIKSLQVTLRLALDVPAKEVAIHTPLMYLTKGETFMLANNLGCLNLVIEKTHTCYNGNREPHPWGRGCGECQACKVGEAGDRDYLNMLEDDRKMLEKIYVSEI